MVSKDGRARPRPGAVVQFGHRDVLRGADVATPVELDTRELLDEGTGVAVAVARVGEAQRVDRTRPGVDHLAPPVLEPGTVVVSDNLEQIPEVQAVGPPANQVGQRNDPTTERELDDLDGPSVVPGGVVGVEILQPGSNTALRGEMLLGLSLGVLDPSRISWPAEVVDQEVELVAQLPDARDLPTLAGFSFAGRPRFEQIGQVHFLPPMSRFGDEELL